MDEKTRYLYELRAKIIKAAAHPSRLFILDKLKEHEHCVCDLTEMLGFDASTISKHLSVLKGAGLVKDEKRGLKVYYSLTKPCILNMMGCIDKSIKENAKKNLGIID